MLRLFARGPKGKGAGNPHETKEQAHQASLLSISARLKRSQLGFSAPISRRRQDSRKHGGGSYSSAAMVSDLLLSSSSPPLVF